MSTFWIMVGIVVLAGVVYEIYAGQAFLHRVITRAEEPGFYWSLIILWTVLGVSCFIPY